MSEMSKMKFSLDHDVTHIIALRFDAQGTEYVQHMKERLCKFYDKKPASSKPHVTLTDWSGNRKELFNELTLFCEDIPRFQFTFWSVGSFTQDGVVYLKPKNEQYFRNLQADLVEHLGKPKSKFLNPGRWRPHCTLIKGLSSRVVRHAELQVTADYDVFDTTALGLEIMTKGYQPMFVGFQ